MKFSICIPNYNYATYISETIRSVLAQDVELEVLVADNASTDDSVSIVEGFGDDRIHIIQNQWNVGFAGNLDKACANASGDRMILLSSDDLSGPESLKTYALLAKHIGAAAEQAIFASDQYVIDGDGVVTGSSGHDARQWQDARHDPELSEKIGAPVLRVAAKNLLARSLSHLRTPFAFASTCYPRALYSAVEGYGGGHLMNPDKAFAWKLLTVADEVFYIDKPLFSYREHSSNQSTQQRESGALKHLLDQYRATFDLAPKTLAVAALKHEDLAQAFIDHDIVLRGLMQVAEGERQLARRGLNFGRAAYPKVLSRSRRAWLLRMALALGPLGTFIANRFLLKALASYRQGGIIGDKS